MSNTCQNKLEVVCLDPALDASSQTASFALVGLEKSYVHFQNQFNEKLELDIRAARFDDHFCGIKKITLGQMVAVVLADGAHRAVVTGALRGDILINLVDIGRDCWVRRSRVISLPDNYTAYKPRVIKVQVRDNSLFRRGSTYSISVSSTADEPHYVLDKIEQHLSDGMLLNGWPEGKDGWWIREPRVENSLFHTLQVFRR